MRKHIIALIVAVSCSYAFAADYIADRKAAMELMNAKKYEEAMAAFLKMAETAQLPAQKADALEQAAMCANALKNYDKAMELAKQIPDLPTSQVVQMRLMQHNRQRDQVIAQFKDEDFSAWPEKAAGEAFYIRGECYFTLKNGTAAEADLKKAMANLGEGYNRDHARLLLAQNYQQNLNAEGKALEIFMEGVTTAKNRYGWICLTCITSAADILRRQGKTEEAMQLIIRNLEVEKMKSGYWAVAVRQSLAEILAAQGKKAEAIARLKEALPMEGISEGQKKAVEKRLAELEGGTK